MKPILRILSKSPSLDMHSAVALYEFATGRYSFTQATVHTLGGARWRESEADPVFGLSCRVRRPGLAQTRLDFAPNSSERKHMTIGNYQAVRKHYADEYIYTADKCWTLEIEFYRNAEGTHLQKWDDELVAHYIMWCASRSGVTREDVIVIPGPGRETEVWYTHGMLALSTNANSDGWHRRWSSFYQHPVIGRGLRELAREGDML